MNDIMRRLATAIALAFTLAQAYAQRPLNPPLKNWQAPLYWAPTPAEAEPQRLEQRIVQRDASPVAQAAGIFTPPGPMTFIAMTPCRVMDTRAGQGFTGAFGPPSLPAFGTARQVPMPSSSCNIPSNAGAYSLNVTAVSPGALSFLSVWPAGQPYPNVSTLNDSSPSGGAVANAAIVPAGTAGAIQMVAGNITDVIVDINGYYAAPTDGVSNTAIGAGTLTNITSGQGNTASGFQALLSNTTGSSNTASGSQALERNIAGDGNTASGFSALQLDTSGSYNIASGYQALQNNTTGSNNIAIGYQAAFNVSGGNNSNIHIGSYGAPADNNAIRIGNPAFQTSFFVAGVNGVATGLGSPVQVLIDANGQLGTMSSSRRFKEDIQDMGDASSGLMSLRPVTFRYKQPYTDGSKPIDYGLIAEEVADVYPDLVAYSPSGEVQTVQYQKVNAMLLNEVQKQHQELSKLKALLSELEKQLEALASPK